MSNNRKIFSFVLGSILGTGFMLIVNVFFYPDYGGSYPEGKVVSSRNTVQDCQIGMTKNIHSIKYSHNETHDSDHEPKFRSLDEILEGGLTESEVLVLEHGNEEIYASELPEISERLLIRIVSKMIMLDDPYTRRYLTRLVKKSSDNNKLSAVRLLLESHRKSDHQIAIELAKSIDEPILVAEIFQHIFQHQFDSELTYFLLESVAGIEALKNEEGNINNLIDFYYQSESVELKSMLLVAMTPSVLNDSRYQQILALIQSSSLPDSSESLEILREWVKQSRTNLTTSQANSLTHQMNLLAMNDYETFAKRRHALEIVKILNYIH
ncbi:hypothetical protein IC617_15050 [Neiella sp. HB171785]|uniref:Uncharacterized protein n=1 Tax=Neiella litorisoli TaxID=2771431 RepID=A0A8J6QLX2_9GAMM|nr:hypothetical protein [Neiella litorisoli]MBD1390747.1 hypothetical protein [Neiella litorisoli]